MEHIELKVKYSDEQLSDILDSIACYLKDNGIDHDEATYNEKVWEVKKSGKTILEITVEIEGKEPNNDTIQ